MAVVGDMRKEPILWSFLLIKPQINQIRWCRGSQMWRKYIYTRTSKSLRVDENKPDSVVSLFFRALCIYTLLSISSLNIKLKLRVKFFEAICDEARIIRIISSSRDEIVGRLNDRISPDILREAELIQKKHDILSRDELARPFTI